MFIAPLPLFTTYAHHNFIPAELRQEYRRINPQILIATQNGALSILEDENVKRIYFSVASVAAKRGCVA
jgi:hypothetical protein